MVPALLMKRQHCSSGGDAVTKTGIKKYGTASAYMDKASGVYLPYTSDLNFGGGQSFTVEYWVYPTNLSTNSYDIFAGQWAISNSATSSWVVGFQMGKPVAFLGRADGTYVNLLDTTTRSPGQWYHFALVVSGTTASLFVNGIMVASNNSIGTIVSSTRPIGIGRVQDVDGTSWDPTYGFNGYIDDFRITKGVARYTANFTPSQTLVG